MTPVWGTMFIENLVGAGIKLACSKGTRKYKTLDIQILGEFKNVPGAYYIGLFILRMVDHCEIIIASQVKNIVGTIILIYTLDDFLQVGEIPDVNLSPPNIFMLWYS